MYRFKSILIGMLSLALLGAIVSCSEEAEAADEQHEQHEQYA